MKSKDQKNNLRRLSLSIGDFIRYWGFRRIHGAIWCQLYLSKVPLSCTDLTSRIGLSKSLISPALEELCKYKLIREAPAPNEKSKVYGASENINEVIKHVLKNREAKMLKKITADFSKVSDAESSEYGLDEEKVKSLGEMIFAANLMLQIMISQKDILNMPLELQI